MKPATFAASVLFSTSAVADFALQQPIDCVLGQTCYVQQFLDHISGAGVSDFRCSSMSYNGHKGTDFGLISLVQQAEGVNVLAAADGIVRGLRDGMDDILWSTIRPMSQAANVAMASS